MPNVAVIIEGENKRKLNARNTPKKENKMQLPKKQSLPTKRMLIPKYHIPGHSNQRNEHCNLCRTNSLKARFGNHKASLNSTTN